MSDESKYAHTKIFNRGDPVTAIETPMMPTTNRENPKALMITMLLLPDSAPSVSTT